MKEMKVLRLYGVLVSLNSTVQCNSYAIPYFHVLLPLFEPESSDDCGLCVFVVTVLCRGTDTAFLDV